MFLVKGRFPVLKRKLKEKCRQNFVCCDRFLLAFLVSAFESMKRPLDCFIRLLFCDFLYIYFGETYISGMLLAYVGQVLDSGKTDAGGCVKLLVKIATILQSIPLFSNQMLIFLSVLLNVKIKVMLSRFIKSNILLQPISRKLLYKSRAQKAAFELVSSYPFSSHYDPRT